MQIFKSTKNTRLIIKDSFKYIRSDVPTEVSDAEKDWLLSNNVNVVIDLRTDAERERKRCPLMDDARFTYCCFAVRGGDIVPKSTNNVSKSYVSMVDEKFDEMIEFLLTTPSNVLYFCNAGKDRTGVVSAVLLHKLGYSKEYIVNDYLESKTNLAEFLKAYASQNPGGDINVITPNKRYIEDFLDWYVNR